MEPGPVLRSGGDGLIMSSMFASGSAWLCLIVGVVILVEAAAFCVLRGRPGTRRRGPRGDQVPMLVSMGVTLLSESVPRLTGLSGAGMTVALLVGVAGAVATLVFATRSFDAQRRDGRETGAVPHDRS